jgi:hypothetical protein
MTSFFPERIPYVIVTDQYFNTMKTIEVLLSDNRRFVMKCQASRFGPLFEPILHSQLVPMSSSAAFKVWNKQILLAVSYKNPPPKLNYQDFITNFSSAELRSDPTNPNNQLSSVLLDYNQHMYLVDQFNESWMRHRWKHKFYSWKHAFLNFMVCFCEQNVRILYNQINNKQESQREFLKGLFQELGPVVPF